MTRVLVLGAGVSGMAAARLARDKGMAVTIYDRSPKTEPLEAGFGFAGGEWDPLLLRGIDLVVTSPGFSERSRPIVDVLESGLPIISEIEMAWRHVKSPVIAVTGTNGKTTVTEATSAMLAASGLDALATGNIGAPLSDFTESDHDALVVEVSSFQLRFIEEFHPTAAAITNVAEDHLDWHGSLYAYRQAKARIFENQTETDLLVYDSDDRGASEMAATAPSTLYPVSGTQAPEGGGGRDQGQLRVMGVAIDLDRLANADSMMLSNLACAAALAMRAGATADGVTDAAIAFTPGRHRRSVVTTTAGVSWVDDSKATNPHAALASIRAFDKVVLIAGGLAKGLDVTPLAHEPNLKLLLGIGTTGANLAESAGEKGRHAGSLEIAVEMAAQAAEPGDTVLLAPGCASFDQFDSYKSRGERFRELVLARVGGQAG